MSSEDPLFTTRVAILGLGLMGGSLGLALRGRCASLVGFDPDSQAVDRACELGAIQQGSTAVASAAAGLLAETDLVVLAAPVRTILKLLGDLPGLHPGGPVVLDLGSTKSAILQAMDRLPGRFDPIGGHPMCGKEKSSIYHAEAGLYRGAPFALTPLPRTTPQARALAEALARAVGAHPLWLDAETHDRWVAATSHTPYLAACALAAATPAETFPMAGPGLRGAVRLAGSSVEMMGDVLATNRGPVLDALRRFREALEQVEDALKADDEPRLAALLESGREKALALAGISQAAPHSA